MIVFEDFALMVGGRSKSSWFQRAGCIHDNTSSIAAGWAKTIVGESYKFNYATYVIERNVFRIVHYKEVLKNYACSLEWSHTDGLIDGVAYFNLVKLSGDRRVMLIGGLQALLPTMSTIEKLPQLSLSERRHGH